MCCIPAPFPLRRRRQCSVTAPLRFPRDTLGTDYFDDAAVHFCSNIDLFIGCLTESHRLLNVNYPYLPANEYRGIRVGYLAEQIYPIAYIEIKDENGSIGYKTPEQQADKLRRA